MHISKQNQVDLESSFALDVAIPEYGEERFLSLTTTQKVVLSFNAKTAIPIIEGVDFVLSFDINGDGRADSRIIFKNLVEETQDIDEPFFIIDEFKISAQLLIGRALTLEKGETLESVICDNGHRRNEGRFKGDSALKRETLDEERQVLKFEDILRNEENSDDLLTLLL
ncbi:MAG: hypothetical protein V7776_22305 [Halopseudomonas aestusnigri]